MATLKDIHDKLRQKMGRGTALNSVIPGAITDAARWAEQNYSFSYMQKFGEVSVDPLAAEPQVIEIPSTTVKDIKALWRVTSEGGKLPLQRIDARDLNYTANPDAVLTTETVPTAFYTKGTQYIVLDLAPAIDTDFQIEWYEYTPWPQEETASNWMIENGQALLLAQARLELSEDTLDVAAYQVYKLRRDEAANNLIRQDEDFALDGQKFAFEYTGDKYP